MRTARTTLLALVGLLVAGTAGAQEDPGQPQTPPAGEEQPTRLQAPRTAELVFEREIFDYPSFPRRNPFIALVASEGGPRYEQMRLRGIIHSTEPGGSVALLALGTVAAPRPGNQEPTGDAVDQSRRVRAGETWGNVRVLEIRQREILVQVEEFGLMEERIMRLPTRGQGD